MSTGLLLPPRKQLFFASALPRGDVAAELRGVGCQLVHCLPLERVLPARVFFSYALPFRVVLPCFIWCPHTLPDRCVASCDICSARAALIYQPPLSSRQAHLETLPMHPLSHSAQTAHLADSATGQAFLHRRGSVTKGIIALVGRPSPLRAPYPSLRPRGLPRWVFTGLSALRADTVRVVRMSLSPVL